MSQFALEAFGEIPIAFVTFSTLNVSYSFGVSYSKGFPPAQAKV